MRIEPDDVWSIGNEVRQCVDIVKNGAPVAIVRDVFDAAHIDAGGGDNFLDRVYDAPRRDGSPYFQSNLMRIARKIFEKRGDIFDLTDLSRA